VSCRRGAFWRMYMRHACMCLTLRRIRISPHNTVSVSTLKKYLLCPRTSAKVRSKTIDLRLSGSRTYTHATTQVRSECQFHNESIPQRVNSTTSQFHNESIPQRVNSTTSQFCINSSWHVTRSCGGWLWGFLSAPCRVQHVLSTVCPLLLGILLLAHTLTCGTCDLIHCYLVRVT
jgi:hypothetical protein